MMRIYKSPKTSGSRPARRDRQLERILTSNKKLEMWLSKDTWTASEATYLMAGLDPDIESIFDSPGDPGTWLSDTVCKPQNMKSLVEEAARLLARSAMFCKGKESQNSLQWIEIARKADFVPVWFQYFQHMRHDESQLVQNSAAKMPKQAYSIASAIKGKKKAENSPQRRLLDRVGRPLFDGWNPSMETITSLAARITKAMTQENSGVPITERTIANRIKAWRSELTSPAQQTTSPAQQRASKGI